MDGASSLNKDTESDSSFQITDILVTTRMIINTWSQSETQAFNILAAMIRTEAQSRG